MRPWMWMSPVGLLLVAATLGCGERPERPGPAVGRDEAIAVIEKLGGRIGYDEESPGRPIVYVDLNGTEVTDVHLVHLKGLTSLQRLDLSGCAC
jgi:hypothetical protein